MEAIPKEPAAPFVVGVSRSGTTLLRMMLDAHHELAIPPETHFIPDVEAGWAEGGVDEALRRLCAHPRLPAIYADDAEARRVVRDAEPGSAGELLRALYRGYAEARGKSRWGDKTPRYTEHLARIRRLLPESRFIHLIRDGRDVALSLMPLSFGPSTLEDAAREWRDHVRAARTAGARLGGYLEVRYEHLVTEPQAQLERICAFAGLVWDPAMLGYATTAPARLDVEGSLVTGLPGVRDDVRRGLHQHLSDAPDPTRAGRWRERLGPAELRRFEEIAGDLLDELGYERGVRPHPGRRER